MKRTTKMLSLILAALMLSASVLSACSDEPQDSPDTTAPSSGDTTTAEVTTAAETEPSIPYDYIEKKNYNGKVFTIATPSSSTRYIPGQFMTEAETGDVIMDAAYERNLHVSEALGVTIKHLMPVDSAGFAAAIRAENQAQGDSWDLISGFTKTTAPLVVENQFIANTDLPYQEDISAKAWYSAKMNDAALIGGKQYIFFSDMTCITLSCTYGTFFNVSLGERNGIKDLDKLALEGKWTFDKLLECVNGFSKDLDGSGTWDKNDQYGIGNYTARTSLTGSTAMTYVYGFGERTAILNDNGEPEIRLNSERMPSIIEKINDLYWVGNRCAEAGGADSAGMFAEGRLLFWNAIIMHAANYMRDMKDTYVALPMPKYDEAQEDYYTIISAASSMVEAVPVSAKDKEFSSAVFDALAYEGNLNVIPAYFEISMKLKHSADNTASQLFDVIRDGTVVDFGLLYDGTTGMFTLPAKLLGTNSNSFASEFAALKDKTLAYYKEVIDMMKK
ncbi:MAG: hypothetical protein E7662_08445 [Ruminococcaceae bacterium]|nr:hypothetical protein [Oscillospiraceae bacterium]